MTKKERNVLTYSLLALSVVLVPLVWFHHLDTASAIEIVITFTLVVITLAYVKRTADIAEVGKGQTEASIKMAEEMREQRYDSVRPVIDILRDATDYDKKAEMMAATGEDPSNGLSCILHNIGVGPALDVFSYARTPTDPNQHHDYGTVGAGDSTHRLRLSIHLWALVVYYGDVYGRTFESKRELRVDRDRGVWEIGPLKVAEVQESELP